MFRAVPLLLTLCACVEANASIRFFFTSSADPAGLSDPTHVFNDTDGKRTDGTSYALKDAAPQVGVPTVDPSAGEYLYLWMKFEGEQNNRIVQGINLAANNQSLNKGRGEWDRGIYLGLDENGDSGEPARWQDASRTFDDGHHRTGMVLAAIVTPGVRNGAGDAWLYRGGEDRVALIGAILPEAGAYEIRMGLGVMGVSYRKNADGERNPETVKLGGDDQAFEGGVRGDDAGILFSTDADAFVVPEPGGLLFLLVALTLRRRG